MDYKATTTGKAISYFMLAFVFISLTFRYQLRMPNAGYYATLANLLLATVTLGFALKVLINKKNIHVKSKLDLSFALFSIAIFVGLINGYLRFGITQDYLNDARYFYPFILFFIVTSTSEIYMDVHKFTKKLIILLLLSNLIVATYTIFASILHFDYPLDISNPWDLKLIELEGFTRIASLVPTRILLITPCVIFSLLHIKKLPLVIGYPLLALNTLALIVTFTRLLVVGAIISVILYFIIMALKGHISEIAKILLTIALVSLFAQAFFSHYGAFAGDLVMLRFEPFLNSQSIYDVGSAAHRIEESKAFLNVFQENPSLGTGLGTTVTFYSTIFHEYVKRSNWHNTYSMLLGKLGLLGFLSFTLILISFFSESIFVFRKSQDLNSKLFAIVSIVIVASLTVTSFGMSDLISLDLTPLFVVLAGLIGIYASNLRASGKEVSHDL